MARPLPCSRSWITCAPAARASSAVRSVELLSMTSTSSLQPCRANRSRGIGRNLVNLDGYAVGVDHNPESVAIAVDRELTAFTSDEFKRSQFAAPDTFDSLLMAHVIEHLRRPDALELLRTYLPYVRGGGT